MSDDGAPAGSQPRPGLASSGLDLASDGGANGQDVASPGTVHDTHDPDHDNDNDNDNDHDREREREQRRAPRFSWTLAIEATFFQSLCQSVQLGLRENNTFKPEAWSRALDALIVNHNAVVAKSHLINKADNARKRFRMWRGLREHPGFRYDPATRTVTATDATWKTHVAREPLSRSLRGRPFEHEQYMEILYPDVVGSGGVPKRSVRIRRRGTDDFSALEESDVPSTHSVHDLQADSSPPQKLSPQPPSTTLRSDRLSRLQGASLWQPISYSPNAAPQAALPLQHLQHMHPLHHPLPHPAPPMPHPQLLSPQQHKPVLSAHEQLYSQPLPMHMPTSAATMLHGSTITLTSALTPPDETAVPSTRKRAHPSSTAFDTRSASSTPSSTHVASHQQQQQQQQLLLRAEKRRRTGAFTSIVSPADCAPPPTAIPTPIATADATAVDGSFDGSSHSIEQVLRAQASLLEQILELLQKRQPRWSEQAIDIFLHDFVDEDMDLQVKIAEKVLADESKAMAFCKMPAQLRQHWVKRLRELSLRNAQ